jgi:glycosyltransferase involved in cell wall biosynthesis
VATMKVLIVAPLFPPATGGSATYYGLLTEHLAASPEVESVTVLTSRWPGSPAREALGDVQVRRLLPPLPLARTRGGWLVGEVLRLPRTVALTCLVARETRADVLHVHKTRSYSGAVVAGRLLRRPVVGDVRDMFDPDLFRMSTLLIACGQAAVGRLTEKGIPEDRVQLLPIPVDLEPVVDEGAREELLRGRLGDRGFILYVGDLSAPKGVPELLEAYRRMREDRQDLDLVLVGKEVTSGGGVATSGEGVHVLGPLPHPQVLGLMRHAQVLILPSRFELYPRVCVEGVLMGTRVVFPPVVPEFRELVPDHVLPKVTPEAIRETLERVLASDDRPDYPLGTHDIGAITRGVLDIYRRLVNR